MSLSKRIEAYLQDHKTAWAKTTYKTESSRLSSRSAHLDLGPQKLYAKLLEEGMKPYSMKTLFLRICHLEAWANQGTAYRDWYRKHLNRFKHVYVPKKVGLTYEEAIKRIKSLKEPYRTQALEMIKTGLRISEVARVKDGFVLGKGEKTRPVFGTITMNVPARTLQAKLKAIGLYPHALRKLCATKISEKDVTPQDLCAIFGWSSIQTAYSYLQTKSNERLKELMET